MSQKQAPGFAAALDRLMAQGGDRKKSSKGFTFSQGRLKGLTKDQAVQKGRNMWEGASDAVRNMYAKREQDLQAPVEKEAGGSLPMPGAVGGSSRGGQSSTPTYAPGVTRPTRTPGAEDPASAPGVSPTTSPAAGGDLTQQAMGTPEDQARVQQMLKEGEGYASASVGGYDRMAAMKMQDDGRKKAALERVSVNDPAAAEQVRANEEAKRQKVMDDADAESAASKAEKERQDRALLGLPATAPPAATPVVAQSVPDVTPRSQSDDQPVGGLAARELAARKAAMESSPTGGRVMEYDRREVSVKNPDGTTGTATGRFFPTVQDGDVKQKVNPLTGLPFGHQAGDALPSGADAAMQERGVQSQRRMDIEQSREALKPGSTTAAPQQKPNMDAFQGPASQRTLVGSSVAPSMPKRENDPDIIAKDNAAYAAYQGSFGGGTDAAHAAAKGAGKALYDGASSEDQASLVANSLKRASGQLAAATNTAGAPRATVVTQPAGMPNMPQAASRFKAPVAFRRR